MVRFARSLSSIWRWMGKVELDAPFVSAMVGSRYECFSLEK